MPEVKDYKCNTYLDHQMRAILDNMEALTSVIIREPNQAGNPEKYEDTILGFFKAMSVPDFNEALVYLNTLELLFDEQVRLVKS